MKIPGGMDEIPLVVAIIGSETPGDRGLWNLGRGLLSCTLQGPYIRKYLVLLSALSRRYFQELHLSRDQILKSTLSILEVHLADDKS